jgi:hypothetical protein
VAASDGRFGAGAYVVPHEPTTLRGTGWDPHRVVQLDADRATGTYIYFRFDAVADADGTFTTPFGAELGRQGIWVVTADQAQTPSYPYCEAMAYPTVLPPIDVWGGAFLWDIKWLYVQGLTAGCDVDRYCPEGIVTRGQAASFLARALGLAPAATDAFTDDDDSLHEANINRLHAAGITVGCGPTTYCPDAPLTRAQMATFLARGLDLPPTSTDFFTDDDGSVHEDAINRVRAVGLTYGCGGAHFCPDGLVTRGQIAAFLHRANRGIPAPGD